MPSYKPPRYRLLDLVFAVSGTVAFLGDLGIDVWSAVKYYKGGDPVFAALHFGLYVVSSVVLQILSWGWFWADWKNWGAEAVREENAANGHTGVNGMRSAVGTEDRRCSVDAAVFMNEQPAGSTACHQESLLQANGNTQQPAATTRTPIPDTPLQGAGMCSEPSTEDAEEPAFLTNFYTSHIWQRPSCLIILHLLQLGYPFRCLHSLEVGIAAYRSQENSPNFSQYQEYACFLTQDISMMRLVETFLENTPQLILALYVIIQQETTYLFQYFSMVISLICIIWAVVDYHQSLRQFLKDKKKLNLLSSVIYYLWNFCLISTRIMCITLFTVTHHWMIALHFVAVWLVFFFWVCQQNTDFMKSHCLEPFYRATVAVILYFSWFNIADGRTIYRCIFYHTFITTDSLILLLSWRFQRFPSLIDKYDSYIFGITGLLTFLGLMTRFLYYKCVHPNVTREPNVYYDEPDGLVGMFTPTLKKKSWKQNDRMVHLAQQIY